MYTNLIFSPLCIPNIQVVKILNEGDVDLKIKSVGTDSQHFHPTISEVTVAPSRGGRISITVIYLPKTIGDVEASLIIQSNFGPIIYRLKGKGVENQYRVKPILGHKLPVDVDYRRPISIYNPTSEILRVKEITTSEGFLLLSLPDINLQHGKSDPGRLWEIPPHAQKTVIFLDFQAKTPGKFQGFIHITTEKENLIVHVEFIVNKSGVHSVVDEIDFGTLINPTEKRSREIILLNSSPFPVSISDVYSQSPDTQLKIEFKRGTVLQEGALTTIATISYHGNREGKFQGKILFKTNDTNPVSSKIEVPFRANVIHGNLDYLVNATAYYVGNLKEEIRPLLVVNYFSTPMQVRSAEIDDQNFKLLDFQPGSVLEVNTKKKLLSIRFKSNNTNILYKTHLVLETNITKLFIPIYCFHATLQYYSAKYVKLKDRFNIEEELKVEQFNEKKGLKLNFGALKKGEKRDHFFFIKNINPVAISIFEMGAYYNGRQKSNIKITLGRIYETENNTLSLTSSKMGTALTDEDDFILSPPRKRRRRRSYKKKNHLLLLKPGYKALLRVEIQPTKEEIQTGSIEIKSTYNTLSIPYTYLCSSGYITFSYNLNFDKTFPGKMFKKNIWATSTFEKTIKILKITSTDKIFIPFLTNKVLKPNKKTKIGFVLFDSSHSSEKKKDKSLISESDIKNYQKRNAFFPKGSNQRFINSEIVVYTNILKKYEINITASLTKPKIAVSKIDFTLVHLGASAIHFIRVTNPSDQPIKVKLFLGGKNFSLQHDDQFKILEPSKGIVPPHKYVDFGPLKYTPNSRSKASCELYIKNNLTIFEIIKVLGEGGVGRIAFKQDNKMEDKLIFWNIEEKEIGKFESNSFIIDSSNRDSLGFIVFQKRFVLQNIGNLPVNIHHSFIEGSGCHFYGVTLLNCGNFTLNPNEERSFTISYKPDFTVSKINVPIIIETRAGRYRFPMVIVLPHHLLPYLYGSQPITFTQNIIRLLCTCLIFGIAFYLLSKVYREIRWIRYEDHLELILPTETPLPKIITSPRKTKEVSPRKKKKSTKKKGKKEGVVNQEHKIEIEKIKEDEETLKKEREKEEENPKEVEPEPEPPVIEEASKESEDSEEESEEEQVEEAKVVEEKKDVVLINIQKENEEKSFYDHKSIEEELLKKKEPSLPIQIKKKPLMKQSKISRFYPLPQDSPRKNSPDAWFNEEYDASPRFDGFKSESVGSPSHLILNRLTQALKPQNNTYFSLFNKHPKRDDESSSCDEEDDKSHESPLGESNSFFSMDVLQDEYEEKNTETFQDLDADDSNLPEFFKTK